MVIILALKSLSDNSSSSTCWCWHLLDDFTHDSWILWFLLWQVTLHCILLTHFEHYEILSNTYSLWIMLKMLFYQATWLGTGSKTQHRASLMGQWLEIHLPIQGTWIQSLVQEGSRWAQMLQLSLAPQVLNLCSRAHRLQQEKPTQEATRLNQRMAPTLSIYIFVSVQFSHSVMSHSLRPHGLQHVRPPCPSPTPGVHSISRPLSQ